MVDAETTCRPDVVILCFPDAVEVARGSRALPGSRSPAHQASRLPWRTVGRLGAVSGEIGCCDCSAPIRRMRRASIASIHDDQRGRPCTVRGGRRGCRGQRGREGRSLRGPASLLTQLSSAGPRGERLGRLRGSAGGQFSVEDHVPYMFAEDDIENCRHREASYGRQPPTTSRRTRL